MCSISQLNFSAKRMLNNFISICRANCKFEFAVTLNDVFKGRFKMSFWILHKFLFHYIEHRTKNLSFIDKCHL